MARSLPVPRRPRDAHARPAVQRARPQQHRRPESVVARERRRFHGDDVASRRPRRFGGPGFAAAGGRVAGREERVGSLVAFWDRRRSAVRGCPRAVRTPRYPAGHSSSRRGLGQEMRASVRLAENCVCVCVGRGGRSGSGTRPSLSGKQEHINPVRIRFGKLRQVPKHLRLISFPSFFLQL